MWLHNMFFMAESAKIFKCLLILSKTFARGYFKIGDNLLSISLR